MYRDIRNLLQKEEAVRFVENNLKIGNFLQRLSIDRFDLLNEIISTWQQLIPLQNYTLLVKPIEKRIRPEWQTVKERIFAFIGGLCYELHVFMYVLLKSLDFDVYPVPCNVSQPRNHAVIIVQNMVASGDRFLVEAGCGYPTFQAIDLSFDKVSPLYSSSFLNYRFVRQVEPHTDTFLRIHKSHDLQLPSENSQIPVGWRKYYDFGTARHDLQQILDMFDNVYSDTSSTRAHYIMRCTCFPGQRALLFRNNRLLKENDKYELESTMFQTSEELVDSVVTGYPALPRSTVTEAVDNWWKYGERDVDVPHECKVTRKCTM